MYILILYMKSLHIRFGLQIRLVDSAYASAGTVVMATYNASTAVTLRVPFA